MINDSVIFKDEEIIATDEIKVSDLGFLNYFFSNNGYVAIVQQLLLNYKKNFTDIIEIEQVEFKKPICFIENFFIHEDMRGQGKGTVMMKELFHICQSENITEIYLIAKVQDNDFKLIDFYNKLGFDDILDIDHTHYLLKKDI